MNRKWIRSLLLGLIFVLPLAFLQAQPDSGLNFQGVARDASGNLMINSTIGIRFVIQQTAPVSQIVYVEQHGNVQTDAFGHFTLVIGTGTAQQGTFSNIDWQNSHQVFVSMEVSPNSYVPIGSMDLQKVPKAFFADNAAVADSVSQLYLRDINDVSLAAPDSGNLLMWDGSQWIPHALPKTQKIFLGPTSFHPQTSGTSIYKYPGGVYGSGAGILLSPVTLPVGSTVSDIQFHYYDDEAAGSIIIHVYRHHKNVSSTLLIAAGISVGSQPAYMQVGLAMGPFSIEKDYFHYIEARVSGSWWSTDLKVKGIEITYTLP